MIWIMSELPLNREKSYSEASFRIEVWETANHMFNPASVVLNQECHYIEKIAYVKVIVT